MFVTETALGKRHQDRRAHPEPAGQVSARPCARWNSRPTLMKQGLESPVAPR